MRDPGNWLGEFCELPDQEILMLDILGHLPLMDVPRNDHMA